MSSSQSKPALKLDWCSYEAAKYAVEHWHYSRRMPAGKLVTIGVWEGGHFIGAVAFGRGGNNRIGAPFGLTQTEVAELVRIALTRHSAPVSRIASIAVKMLCRQSPGLRLLVSYADPEEGHHGGIYQAMGWIYAGSSVPQRAVRVEGKWMHKRTASSLWGTASPARIRQMTGREVDYGPVQWKHTYYYPLDADMRARIAPLAKPYPKRSSCETGEIDSAAQTNAQTGGASPTVSLPSLDNLQGDITCA